MMTEAKAWREIARRWVERDEEGAFGTCPMIEWLECDGLIDKETRRSMENRIQSALNDCGSFGPERYAYPPPHDDEEALTYDLDWGHYIEKYREARALAALWLALEADAEVKVI